jgi:Domain of unknown function (DUF4158)
LPGQPPALHLCGLRRTGRFIDDPAQVPGNALIHLANRLGEEPPVRLLLLPRPATDSAIRARVRDHLGFVPFSADARNRLEAALSEVAADGLTLADLIQRAETALRAAKVILPARTTLDRLVASITRQALDGLFNRIATRLPSSLRVALDRLVGQLADDAGTEGRASLGRYRTPSAASMGRFTREARQRLEEIGAMLAGLPDLADVPERIRRQLAQLCRRYDGHALRGFPPDKRHGLLICFLLDRRQGLLDDMAHDNHMTGLMRPPRRRSGSQAFAPRRRGWPAHAGRYRSGRARRRPSGIRGWSARAPRGRSPADRRPRLRGGFHPGRPRRDRRRPRPLPGSAQVPAGLSVPAVHLGHRTG